MAHTNSMQWMLIPLTLTTNNATTTTLYVDMTDHPKYVTRFKVRRGDLTLPLIHGVDQTYSSTRNNKLTWGTTKCGAGFDCTTTVSDVRWVEGAAETGEQCRQQSCQKVLRDLAPVRSIEEVVRDIVNLRLGIAEFEVTEPQLSSFDGDVADYTRHALAYGQARAGLYARLQAMLDERDKIEAAEEKKAAAEAKKVMFLKDIAPEAKKVT